MERKLRLNLGSGRKPIPGWENLDIRAGQNVSRLPYADGAAAEIRASHVLEHFPMGEVADVLREWVRVLTPGGILRVAVPDLGRIMHHYVDVVNGRAQPDTHLLQYVYGGQQNEHDYHKSGFDRVLLTELLEGAGLVEITEWQSDHDDCSALPISLNLQGRKPTGATTQTAQKPPQPVERIRAVMTTPRLVFADTMFAVLRACVPLKIPVEHRFGAYWDKAMDALFTSHLNDGTEYLLTVDYDSVFTKEDVETLIRLADAHPDVDAIVPLQMKRGGSQPLFSTGRTNERGEMVLTAEELSCDLLPIVWGHFGLTLIRVSALREVPAPWFLHQPGPDGHYNGGHVDADIGFWRKFVGAGRRVCLAPRVVIGHLERMVLWPNTEMRAMHQYADDWNEQGKPAGVWQ